MNVLVLASPWRQIIPKPACYPGCRRNHGADAIHPGVGFLSENAEFARKIEEHGYTFIGPSPAMIDLMGDKVTAKQAAKEAGILVVPGSDGEIKDISEARKFADQVGYPVLIKAASGGGGRGHANRPNRR